MAVKEVLSDLIDQVVGQDGSDLHLSESRSPTIRVHGQLISLTKYKPFSREESVELLKGFLTEGDIDRLDKNKEVDFSYSHKEGVRFRGNAYIQQGRYCVALRLIPKEIKTLEELGLPPILETFTQRRQGFFLVVGPTGHGKSTTLAAMVEMINANRAEHISTIEDPVEYVFEPKKSIIDQREIRADTPNFYSALRASFRQDVDVIMVGEMREAETMATAVTAAETGHMVFSTLHTNTAAQTIDRIIDSFVAEQQDQIRVQLAGSLSGIFSIRLIPRVSGGLIPAYELLVGTNAVSTLIRERRTHEIDTVIETSSNEGMTTMNRSLADLVKAGEISVDTAFSYTTNPKSLERLL